MNFYLFRPNFFKGIFLFSDKKTTAQGSCFFVSYAMTRHLYLLLPITEQTRYLFTI